MQKGTFSYIGGELCHGRIILVQVNGGQNKQKKKLRKL